MDTAIVVFTRDLRLHDHPALHQAYVRARQVVPLSVADPAIAAPPNRARFLAESLADQRGGRSQQHQDAGDQGHLVVRAEVRDRELLDRHGRQVDSGLADRGDRSAVRPGDRGRQLGYALRYGPVSSPARPDVFITAAIRAWARSRLVTPGSHYEVMGEQSGGRSASNGGHEQA